MVEIVPAGPDDVALVEAAADLFDGPLDTTALARFLADDGHHLLVACINGVPVGFVSGVETIHPDKGVEMLLYELSIDEAHRRRGTATALVGALGALASERGCYGMWVLTDDDNEPALATYRRAGATAESRHVMFTWEPPRRDA